MPVIKVNDQQYSLRPGPNRLGGGAEADVTVVDNDAVGVQAIVDVMSASEAVIRRAGEEASVRVNGVPLVEPTPLLHGDKVEIAGREVFFSDDSKAGATQYVSSSEVAAAAAKRSGPPRATAATGGRLVSLVDGKEYAVPESGLSIGRDVSSGVVVAQNEVSRRHAEIAPVEHGYEVRDFSANGVYVNGARVEAAQLLSRADVIRVGSEEFRFYADVPAVAVKRPEVHPERSEGSVSSQGSHPERSEGSASVDSDPSVAPLPRDDSRDALPRDDRGAALHQDELATTRPVLAILEVVNEGPTKGTQYPISVPLAHIGRGAHNDVVIPDDSVSDTHAKLQRRDDGWYVVDVGSTNGTYVGGQRIAAERRLDGAPDLRFGGVKTIFRPRDGSADTNKGTRAIASVDRGKQRETTATPAPQITTAPPPAPPARTGLPGWVWAVVVLAVGAAVAFFLLNR